MSVLSVIVVIFSILAATDYVIGNKLGLGAEFEKSFTLLGIMALSMIGMIVIAPLVAELLSPFFDFVYSVFSIDPSVIPAMIFSNDMGGAPLATSVARDAEIGRWSALVVSSMMGATISYTIPVSLGLVKSENHRYLLYGLLCGVVTVPIGCFVSGLMCGIKVGALLINLIPLLLFSLMIGVGLILFPTVCVKIFSGFAYVIKLLVMLGFSLGIINFLADKPVIAGIATIEEGALICFNACIVMTGMFPLISIASRLLKKPLQAFGSRVGINEVAALGLITSLATGTATYGLMNDMNGKGITVNAAFAVSGAFTFAAHLAFTMAFDATYLLPVIVGKLISGVAGLILAFLIFDRFGKEKHT
ncbi:MAG: ethanolamine utilization protein EutH [Clostridia bacterium]|nr:ethanolamine utilization protein EutH [Clostridia bacterium]